MYDNDAEKKAIVLECQLAGWITYAALCYVFGLAVKIEYLILLKAVSQFAGIGFILTHFMRVLVLKTNILQQPFKTQELYFFGITILFSILFAIVFRLVEFVAGFYKINMNAGSVFFVRTSIAFISLLIWNLLYFTYHYIEKSSREQIEKIQLENALITFLFAQNQKATKASRLKLATNAIAAVIYDPALAPAYAGVYVKAKVMQSFLAWFADATEVKWSITNDTHFVRFVRAGNSCKALFNGQGGLVFSLRYGAEKDLPRDVRRLIKSNYIDATIRLVTEVTTSGLKVWVANLTDSDNLIVVTVQDGSLEELHQYKTNF